MPKYLLKATSTAPDCNEFTEVDDVWIDGYHIAGRSLSRHAVRIHKGPGGRLDADMRYQSHHRLDRRQLKFDAIEMAEAGISGLSSSVELNDTLCLIYDTDRPWADRDPVIVMADGSKSPALATKARPEPIQVAQNDGSNTQARHSTAVPASQMMSQIQGIMQSITGNPVPIHTVDPNDPNATPQAIAGIPDHLQGLLTDLDPNQCQILDEILEMNSYDATSIKADLDMLSGGNCDTLKDLQQALQVYQTQ